jgi:CheY-like chemotaxis protein
MDYMLPEMNGVEITRNIRTSNTISRNIPIIAVTAKADDCSRDECLSAGMNDYISKPFAAKEIFSCLAQYFKMA